MPASRQGGPPHFWEEPLFAGEVLHWSIHVHEANSYDSLRMGKPLKAAAADPNLSDSAVS